jgi:hypothetical protein
MRVLLARTSKPERRKAIESEISRIELRMLSGEYQRGRKSARAQRRCNGGELNRFGTSADDDNYALGQPSP